MNKIRLVIPLKCPSSNDILGQNRFVLHKMRNTWHDQVLLAVRTQPSSEQVKFFKDRLGMQGVMYQLNVTARLFRSYDDNNTFPKWCIDGLIGILIKDDSLKHIGKPLINQELMDVKRTGNKKSGTLHYIDRKTGKRTYPETIIEIELIEREPVML